MTRHVVDALFLGTCPADTDKPSLVLVEITADPPNGSHHYLPWDLVTGRAMEVKTIGSIDFDPGSQDPPPFVQKYVRGGYTWKRIR